MRVRYWPVLAIATTGCSILFSTPEPGASRDASADAAADAASDAATFDAAVADAGSDAGPPAMPVPLFPWNGYATGPSVGCPSGNRPDPLRPTFRWLDSGAAGYQVDVRACDWPDEPCTPDDGFQQALITATSFTPDTSLDVGTEGPVGQRYVWRMRACNEADECSAWTEPRYLDVGRQDGDFDGDGFADVLVGAPGLGTGTGGAVVLWGPEVWTVAPAHTRIYTGAPLSGEAGSAVASVGDLDADGYRDLAIGAPAAAQSVEETVTVLWGAARDDWPATAETFGQLAAPDDQFGAAVAGAGDLDADGYADLAVGELGNGDGVVHIYRGGPVRSIAGRGRTIAAPAPDDPLDDVTFGWAVAPAGDTNGDGYPDLLIGAPFRDTEGLAEAGAAYVLLGGGDDVLLPLTAPEPAENDLFGFALAGVGDLNADGYADVVIAAPFAFWLGGSGKAFLFPGGVGGPDVSRAVTLAPESEVHVGSDVAGAGDLDGDGHDDVVLGAFDAGKAWLYWGQAEGLVDVEHPFELSAAVDLTAMFGSVVAGVGDVDADCQDDVVVSAPLEAVGDSDEGGALYFVSGDSSRQIGLRHMDTPLAEPSGRFGAAVGAFSR